MWEVPCGLVLVEHQRQSQAIGHVNAILPHSDIPYASRTQRH
jgi:hypothetical protein